MFYGDGKIKKINRNWCIRIELVRSNRFQNVALAKFAAPETREFAETRSFSGAVALICRWIACTSTPFDPHVSVATVEQFLALGSALSISKVQKMLGPETCPDLGLAGCSVPGYWRLDVQNACVTQCLLVLKMH